MVATIAGASCHPAVQLPPALIEQNKAAGPAAAAEWVLAEGLRHPPQARLPRRPPVRRSTADGARMTSLPGRHLTRLEARGLEFTTIPPTR
jgi:hypothetical protein